MTSTVKDLEGALDELGVKIVHANADEISAFCPHPDHENTRTPAWSMRKTSKIIQRDGRRKEYPPGTFNCFSCGYKGNIDSLVHDLLGLDGFTGARWLRQFGMKEIEDIPTWEENEQPFVLSYMSHSNITENSLISFIEPTEKQCAGRLFTVEAANHYQILRDEFKNCWILPIRLPDRKLIGWQEKAPQYFRNFPAGVRKSNALFGLDKITTGGVSLVESPLDVPRIYCAGYNAVASYGAGVSEEQMRILIGKTDEIIIGLDNPRFDDAGRKKSEELRKEYGHRVSLWFLNYDHTEAKDPGAMTDDELHWSYQNKKHSLA